MPSECRRSGAKIILTTSVNQVLSFWREFPLRFGEVFYGKKVSRFVCRLRNISVGREIYLSDEKSVSSDEKYFRR